MESPYKADILQGKVALVTGGGSGIGFEIAKQFGNHGASIAIMGRRQYVLDSALSVLQSFRIPAIGFAGDVRKNEDAKRTIESTVMDIDSVGTFTMCHEALKYLKKNGQGKNSSDGGGIILNISATLHYTASWYQIHVSAAKAAIDAITRNLALEWGTEYDIRVNGIAPGPIGNTTYKEFDIKAMDLMPLFKLGEKWDIAMAAIYLASDAGKYVNGTTLVVDGGLWLSRSRYLPKDAVKELSRRRRERSREVPN